MARVVTIAAAVLFAILSAQCAAGQPEEILLREGANGSAVVLLSIARLQQTGLFPEDNLLLRRIAYVETRDGTAVETFRQGYDGGIWAVDQNVFLDTQNVDARPMLRAILAQIQDELSINWYSAVWRDLRKPLYSATAARLALYNFPSVIPQANDIPAQAELWAEYYRQGGSPSEFEAIANELEGSVLESTANEFYVGFLYNIAQPPTLQLFVSTPEPNPVNFSVTTQMGFTFNGTATRRSTTTVILPSTLQVQTNAERNEGIYIKADQNKRILVYGLNYGVGTSDAFLALPCDRYAVDQYEYYALTYHGITGFPYASTILIVACEDNTTITTPSATIKLNRQQTYLIRELLDLSGTKVVSTKPISFFPGHECTFIPFGVQACDHLTEQVPPTNTWGSSFLGASFLGKSSGAIYRVLTAHNSTIVTVNCTTLSQPSTYTLSAAGSWEEFQVPEDSFCSIKSNNPVLVMEYAQGFDLDSIGDPFMTMIPPVEQYSNNYVLNVLPEFSTNYLTIYVAPEYFQPERIFVDNSSLIISDWTAVYCSTGTLCGYITRQNLTAGEHSLYHQDEVARVGVSAYGFNFANSYGYPGGLQLIPIQLATVSFSAATYSIEENGGTISLSIIRGGDTERLAVVLVATDIFQGSASAGQDYNPVTQVLEFQPGETQKNVTIIINNDQKIEAAEQFELYLAGGIGVHLSPFPRTVITIMNDDVIAICSVTEPLMVSPFQTSNSYNFRGTCEHVLLSPCNGTVDFRITVDFLADTLDNGRIGASYGRGMYISREDGTFEVDSNTEIISSNANTTVYERNVTITRAPGRTTVDFQDLGVTIVHQVAFLGQDPSFQVSISNTSVLGQTCGLCGTTDGILLYNDGTTTASLMNMTEVDTFANSYLVEPRNQFLHAQRRECGQVTNDTVVGDPLFTVPITSTGQSLCFEVYGAANRIFNLVSDECTTVNAHYTPMDNPENGNVISSIGIRAVPNSGFCKNIRVEVDGCRAFIDGVEVIGLREEEGIQVRRMRNRVRISMPNCDNLNLVMWTMCQNVSGQAMLRFVITRGLNLRPTSHGLIGQFWNTPVVATQFTGTINRLGGNLNEDQLYIVTVMPQDGAPQRSFLAEGYVRTWENRPGPCLYAGNAQAGWSGEVDALSDPVIQGRYWDYIVDGLFETDFTYDKFDELGNCP